ncbi:uncharacterized protein LOC133781857 [Humulus lupulus]|uniref:uncharacterized protein LOC133781857 n=1 Tax=Humulus lupulus TaxID=3486 RepID=UPI002B41621F|nr:uncharacterized protein LOC133781857 [Humulus lupulus]
MSDPYEKVKGNRLTFKGGDLATRSKPISKTKNKKKKKVKLDPQIVDGSEPKDAAASAAAAVDGSGGASEYTIDAAKRMKYEELFPVEAKKFSYDPKAKVKSIEDALDDRVKKKADRYCK